MPPAMLGRDCDVQMAQFRSDASQTPYRPRNDAKDQLSPEIASQASSVYSTDQTEEGARERFEAAHHRRGESLHVNWTEEDVKRMAGEIYDETIADVHLSLLTYWILEESKNYDVAKSCIRELAVDQGYNAEREPNVHLRRLLRDVESMRPRQAKAPVVVLSSHRIQKDHVAEQSEPTSSVSSPTRIYPPNTPDRPAPLSVRSRTSNATPTTTYRSVSSPVTSHRPGTDDVFGINYEATTSADFIAVDESAQSQASVTASSKHSTASSTLESQDYNEAAENHSSSAADSNSTSSNMSILETASTASVHENQTQYSYGPAPSVSDSEPQITPRVAGQPLNGHSRLKIRARSPLTNVPRFHRPLPLRRYESEAHLYPTAGARGSSDHNRAISAGSMLHDSQPRSSLDRGHAARPRPPAMQLTNLPIRTSSTRPAPNSLQAPPEPAATRPGARQDNKPTQTEDPDTRSDSSTYASSSHGTSPSQALTLAAFPVPPMHNPVGRLPLTTMRVLTRLDAASTTGELATAYRSVAVELQRIRHLLGQTRARGETLGSVEWRALAPFERTWREVNEDLLISIYGRQDTELTAEEVEYVDLIARELRESASARLVHELFCEEVEIF